MEYVEAYREKAARIPRRVRAYLGRVPPWFEMCILPTVGAAISANCFRYIANKDDAVYLTTAVIWAVALTFLLHGYKRWKNAQSRNV